MRSLRWLAVILLLLPSLAAGCGDDAAAPDDASVGMDGSRDEDGGSGRRDAASPDDDGGAPGDDGGVTPDAGPPDAGALEPCDTPGAFEEGVACGSCGTTTRFCNAAGVWEYDPCTGEGVCAPGTTDTVACGNCGTQPRRCTASCEWMDSGECTGEGECMPGATTSSGEGCPSGQQRELTCSDACTFEPSGSCRADGCDTPGEIEDVPCGLCGTRQRFCNSSGVWEYDPCENEGVCMPGTSGTQACGMCGTQTTRCTDSCQWTTSGACGGEGVCTPGATQRTSGGCPAGQTRLVECSDACAFTTVLEPCSATRPVDVLFLVDATPSNWYGFQDQRADFGSRCVTALLALDDVNVGIAYYGDLATPAEPFQAGVELGAATATAIDTSVMTQTDMGGAYDSTFEALWILTGGTPVAGSVPFTCSSGRVAGGCWRSGAERLIVMHTNEAARGGPTATGTPWDPWPTGQSWATVLPRMTSDRTALITILGAGYYADGDPLGMYQRMAADLGQPTTDVHVEAPDVDVVCDAIVARVREIAGL